MEALSRMEASSWWEELGLKTSDKDLPIHSHPFRFRVRVPESTTAAVGLAYVLIMTGVLDFREENLGGVVVGFRRWEIWSESIDRVGYTLLNGLTGHDDTTWLGRTPAILFGDGEFVSAHAVVSVLTTFQWDGYFIPANGDFVATITHHGFFEFSSRNESVHQALIERFAQWVPDRS